MSEAISLKHVSHTYPAQGRKRPARQALQDVSFTVQSGEIFGLLGPNGGGKTTTFHILSTYFPPTEGHVSVLGLDLATHAAGVREQLGVVFQYPSLDKKLTVWENMLHQGHLYGMAGDRLTRRMTDVLQRVKLLDRIDEYVETLSGGLRRRVELAKGLLHRPRVLLLDEPSTGLDPGARHDLWDYLQELKTQDQMTMVVTTHLMEEAEKCDRVAILNEGKLVAIGTPADLKGQIGGDVISVSSPDPEELAKKIQQQYGMSAKVLEGMVRIERDRGHEFIPQLISSYPGQITSVTLGKPTLEDVFIRQTGHRFWMEEDPSS